MADRSSQLVTEHRARRQTALDGLLWLTIVGAAATLCTQLIGTPTRTIAALQALTPWAVPPLLVVVIVADRTSRDRVAMSATVIGFAYLALMLPIAFPASGPAPDPTATPFVLMTTNVLYSNEDFGGVGETIERVRPDVIAFSEVTTRIAGGLLALPAAGRYPHRVVVADGGASGMMLWSRFPAADNGPVASAWRSIDVVVDTPSGEVRVVTLHPPPPVFDDDAWRRDLDSLDDVAAASDLPTAIVGDLNASYFHPVFRRAMDDAGLLDAARATGDGHRFTPPG